MTLRGSKTEDEFREQLIASREALFRDDRYRHLVEALRARFQRLRTAHVLHWVPEDLGEITMLVDDEAVVVVDADEPRRLREIALPDYERGLRKRRQIQLAIARALASEELGRS